MTYPTEPAKSANQVVDELAEELSDLRVERDTFLQTAQFHARKRREEAEENARLEEGLAQAEHHFQHIQKLAATLKWSRYVAASSILAHVTAGLDACRNTKAGKE